MDLLVTPAAPKDLAGIAVVTVKAWQATFQGVLPDAFLAGLTVEDQLHRHQALFARSGVFYYTAKVGGEIVERALTRNALRRSDHQVPQASIKAVAAAFEPPCRSEGFVEIVVVSDIH